MKKPFTFLAILVFALVALVHLLRLVFGWEVNFEGSAVPMWPSIVALVVASGLAAGLWWESKT